MNIKLADVFLTKEADIKYYTLINKQPTSKTILYNAFPQFNLQNAVSLSAYSTSTTTKYDGFTLISNIYNGDLILSIFHEGVLLENVPYVIEVDEIKNNLVNIVYLNINNSQYIFTNIKGFYFKDIILFKTNNKYYVLYLKNQSECNLYEYSTNKQFETNSHILYTQSYLNENRHQYFVDNGLYEDSTNIIAKTFSFVKNNKAVETEFIKNFVNDFTNIFNLNLTILDNLKVYATYGHLIKIPNNNIKLQNRNYKIFELNSEYFAYNFAENDFYFAAIFDGTSTEQIEIPNFKYNFTTVNDLFTTFDFSTSNIYELNGKLYIKANSYIITNKVLEIQYNPDLKEKEYFTLNKNVKIEKFYNENTKLYELKVVFFNDSTNDVELKEFIIKDFYSYIDKVNEYRVIEFSNDSDIVFSSYIFEDKENIPPFYNFYCIDDIGKNTQYPIIKYIDYLYNFNSYFTYKATYMNDSQLPTDINAIEIFGEGVDSIVISRVNRIPLI